MKELKEEITKNLEESNFYKALNNIKKLEDDIGEVEEVIFLYFFLYDFMKWLSIHKKCKDTKNIIDKKEEYFNKINKLYKLDKSMTYLNVYIFLETNFRKFDRYTWFRKDEKLINLLNLSLKENPDNLETQFYKLYSEKKIKKCFDFLCKNTLNTKIVQQLLNKIWFDKKYADDSQKLRKQYKLDSENTNFIYNVQKENYEWLYNYFDNNEEEKYKDKHISFGKVCFELKKYDKAINFYKYKKEKSCQNYYILGECYEKKKKKEKAIECYKNYYSNFNAGYWYKGIEKLFKLQAYDEIKDILMNEKSFIDKEYKIFYESKLLYIEGKYEDSIKKLSGILDLLVNHHKELKKDIYLLYISNYYKKTIDFLTSEYNRILDNKDFELTNHYSLNYTIYSVYMELEKYINKLNIEFDNKYSKRLEQYKKWIRAKYISFNHNLYFKSQEVNFNLSEDIELYYLSSFDDDNSLEKRIKIYKNRVIEEPENPHYYLELGKLYFKKNNTIDENCINAEECLKKSIKLAEKYFVYLNGEPEILLIKINKASKEDNKQLFDDILRNFIFYNSYEKDVHGISLEQVFYKYKSFSINLLSSLANDYLYFASPDKLNDPFDVASELLNMNYDNLEINKKDFKTFSLSKFNDNKLMWSHYTNEHTGICIGYKFIYFPSYVAKEKVKYKNTKLEVFQSLIDHWTVKSDDWEYEQEIRLLHYGEKSKIKYTFEVQQAIEENIIALNIESITLGIKFEENKIIKQTIKDIEDKQKRKIKVFKSKIEEQKLIIENVEL
jgi:hypothetical protein